MAGNNQIESWNQQNRNKENDTKNQWKKDFIFQENPQNRQTFTQANQKAEREYSNRNEKEDIVTEMEEIQKIFNSISLQYSSWGPT